MKKLTFLLILIISLSFVCGITYAAPVSSWAGDSYLGSISNTTPIVNITLNFSAINSTSSITSYNWSWDDGTWTNTTDINVSHEFTLIKTHTVNLTVTNESGSHSSTRNIAISRYFTTLTYNRYIIAKYNQSPGVTTLWKPPAGLGNVEYFLVAGGGGGTRGYTYAGYTGGGGGGGGILTNSTTITQPMYNVYVGAGGGESAKGYNSTFDQISANGGGRGGDGGGGAGGAGGSGGGGGNNYGAAGSGSSGQGYNGAAGGGAYGGSGGGGGAGGTATGQYYGGVGLTSSFSGSSVTYAKGGNGDVNNGGLAGSGETGTAELGNGGGGRYVNKGAAGGGGSGVIILKYLIPGSPTVNFTMDSSLSNVISRSASNSSPIIGVPINFSAIESSTAITSYNWSWGDGNWTNTTEPNTSHTFSYTGNLTVNLTVTNASGSNALIKYVDITPFYATIYNSYTVIKFNTTSKNITWRPPAGVTSVDTLVIGGGGGGGAGNSGVSSGSAGGGAGGFIENSSIAVSSDSLIGLYVGRGGSGRGGNAQTYGETGLYSIFNTLTVAGGGGGGGYNQNGLTGGSGGGGAFNGGTAGSGISGQGYDGYGSAGSGANGAGGGGGAGGAASAYNGGTGRTSSITGTPVYYGGGGAGSYYPNGAGTGGNGGGGNAMGGSGTNERGGGGAGAYYGAASGSGGSGVIYIRYLTPGVPVPNFTADRYTGSISNTTPIINTTINFTGIDDPLAPIATWNWSFGDGTYNSSQNVSHEFTLVRNHTVNLTVTCGSTGYSSSTIKYVNISRYFAERTGVYILVKYNQTGYNTSWNPPLNVTNITTLTVAGGGGGGAGSTGIQYGSSGGGAGGVIENSSIDVSSSSIFDIYVGRGGSGRSANAQAQGESGIYSILGNMTVAGGGGGGGISQNGLSGGSGGGGAYNGGTRGSGISGQGYDGSDAAVPAASNNGAGAGGGAGGVGGLFNGGIGVTSTITCSTVYYGGGGAGSYYPNGAGSGGNGGGGNAMGGAGTNERGGGGAGAYYGQASGSGGSGVIYIRYLEPQEPPVSNFTSESYTGSISTASPIINTTLNFSAQNSTGTIMSYNWSWGDGTWTNTTDITTTHEFKQIANHTVNLTATNSGGTNTSTKYVNITRYYAATNGAYMVLTFSQPGYTTSWKPPSTVANVTYLVVAGGGGGSQAASLYSGGAGAGGLLQGSLLPVPGIQPVSVGLGGVPSYSGGVRGGNGGNSIFANLTAIGGGAAGAGSGTTAGAAGGSGGGGANSGGAGGDADYISPRQGYDGGGAGTYPGGGGGAGEPGNTDGQTYGGDGILNSITGSGVWYAGGGSGGGGFPPYAGGDGGGGTGGYGPGFARGSAGTDGLGGGAGGENSVGTAYKGGSGVVIISYTAFPPVANLTANITSGLNPLPVQLNDTSTFAPTVWNWSFTNVTGNNTPVYFSDSQNVSKLFGVGNYSFKLNASNIAGYNVSTRVLFVNVSPGIIPVSNFTSNVTRGTIPLTVQFNDTTTFIPTSWNWYFTNITPGNNTQVLFNSTRNATQTFGIGNFSIKLNTSNYEGYNISYQSWFINASAYPISNFTAEVYTGSISTATPIINTTLNFSGINSTLGVTFYQWYWGDGNWTNTTEANVSHEFKQVANHTVNLTVINATGTSTSTKYVNITRYYASANGANMVLTFNQPGYNTTWKPPSNVANVTYLIVAGGGASTQSSSGYGGGGGGGGLLTGSGLPVPGIQTVFVGLGGVASGGNGGISVFANKTAIGGGAGAPGTGGSPAGSSGGSGGGGGYISGAGGDADYISPRQGYDGGSYFSGTGGGAGGGGGAGQPGNTKGYAWGGDGALNSITGTPVYYAGGGAGGSGYNPLPREGGAGGGGSGGYGPGFARGTAGTDGLGGGGGGEHNVGTSYKGGSGVIIISYTVIAPYANFTTNVTSGFNPATVRFNDTSNNTPTAWNWMFNETSGNSTEICFSTEKNTTWTFGSGNYSIKLTSSNNAGSNTTTRIYYINITSGEPVASFTSNVTTGYPPFVVQFNDTSTLTPTSWQWFFPYGNTDETHRNATWEFNYSIGNITTKYNIGLNASNSYGYDHENKTDYITAYPLNASFSANITTGYYPLPVAFTDLTNNGTTTSWLWDFGDGNTSPLKNPIHTYAEAGIYNVSVNASNAYSWDYERRPSLITTDVPGFQIADFHSNVTTGKPTLNVQFTDDSLNYPDGWDWNFGDLTANVTTQNPVHSYTSAGTYSVSLTSISSIWGNGTTTKVGYITVNPLTPPVVNFHANITSGYYAPHGVLFTDDSTNTPTAWQWSFGDGTANATTRNVSHNYTTTGTYTVNLTAYNADGLGYLSKTNYISLTGGIIPFPGYIEVPKDMSGDGIYDDVNGNVRGDFNDVVAFFTYKDWANANEPIPPFDYNNNGAIDWSDIVALFEERST